MYHLRLLKSLSYTGIVSATKEKPDVFVEDKTTADAAVATGYFKLLHNEEIPADPEDDKHGKTLEEMTVSELESYAAYHNVSLKGISKKADIITKLKKELSDKETKNEVDYGSPTMQELQDY